jgi:hypothetical protein
VSFPFSGFRERNSASPLHCKRPDLQVAGAIGLEASLEGLDRQIVKVKLATSDARGKALSHVLGRAVEWRVCVVDWTSSDMLKRESGVQ